MTVEAGSVGSVHRKNRISLFHKAAVDTMQGLESNNIIVTKAAAWYAQLGLHGTLMA